MADDLGRIQGSILDLRRRVEVLEKKVAGSAVGEDGEVAPAKDHDLDSEHGDPHVRKDPRSWKGPSCVGMKFSECEAEYLLMLARSFEFRAKKLDEENALDNQQRPKSYWPRKDAARARGWARRIVSGWQRPKAEELPPAAPNPFDEEPTRARMEVDDDDEIPF